jgi:hypothetical protein
VLIAFVIAACVRPGTASAPEPAPKPRYVYLTIHTNLVARLAPRADLLETPLDLDLQRVPLGTALGAIFAQAKQEFVIDGAIPAEKPVTLRGKKLLLADALDDLAQQASIGWTQAVRDGRPVLRIGSPPWPRTIRLEARNEVMHQIAALQRRQRDREPTEEELQKELQSLPVFHNAPGAGASRP